MKTRQFKDKEISLLGFGAMRFPTKEENGERVVDLELTERMIDRAIEAGVNYFDTAHPYHEGKSEIILGNILSKYPRESYYIADKFPGHQIMEKYDTQGIFESQLKKCGVEYFDFYLLHNVCESSMSVYLDKSIGIIDYLLEQKKNGRIKHLGFSTHATVEGLDRFLREVGDKMEFCQIQYNYLDRTLQRAEEKRELLKKHGIPIFVMEPVRGGKLANLPELVKDRLLERRPNESVASWCFRWLETVPEVTVVLSGMSNMEQVEDNIRTMSGGDPLTESGCELLYDIAEGLKSSVPCTSCRYCIADCPMGLDIPALLEVYNELSFARVVNSAMRVEFLEESKKPAACIKCGTCARICPQHIKIPEVLASLDEMMKTVPSWRDVCKKREEDQKKLQGKV